MKACTYCGRRNEDGAGRCRECGTEFVEPIADRKAQARWSAGIESLTGMFTDLVKDLDVKRGWSACCLGLLVLALAAVLFQWHGVRKANTPRIVVLATGHSNGQELVTFRLEPPSAAVTYADLVSVSEDGNARPPTVRRHGHVIPIRKQSDPDFRLQFVALPIAGAPGLAYTPGSYTIAYAPPGTPYRVRAGVAIQREGVGDYLWRLRNCWERKTLTPLRFKSYQDPAFVTLEPITNAVAGTR
jgi:ribosomal protein L40E